MFRHVEISVKWKKEKNEKKPKKKACNKLLKETP